MQAYGESFARVYNKRWTGFAQQVAPKILSLYEGTPLGQRNKTLLDLCCGTGQLARFFLERGYRVVGIDLSAPMLDYARDNTAPYAQSGQAQFVQADAAGFELDERFGLVVSTFDALNHLPDEEALRSCFRSVYRVLEPGGLFVSDLNTRAGLEQWNHVSVEDLPDLMIVNRGFYDRERGKAWTRISGFLSVSGGLYERFEQTAYNTAFDLQWVLEALGEVGWVRAYCARIDELGTPIANPEEERRAFVVAHK